MIMVGMAHWDTFKMNCFKIYIFAKHADHSLPCRQLIFMKDPTEQQFSRIKKVSFVSLWNTFTTHKGPSSETTVIPLVKQCHRFYETQKYRYRNHTNPPLVPTNQTNSFHILRSHMFKIHLNIILQSIPRCSKWYLLFRFADKHFSFIYPRSHACYMPSPPSSCLLGTNILLLVLFSNTSNLCFSLRVQDQFWTQKFNLLLPHIKVIQNPLTFRKTWCTAKCRVATFYVGRHLPFRISHFSGKCLFPVSPLVINSWTTEENPTPKFFFFYILWFSGQREMTVYHKRFPFDNSNDGHKVLKERHSPRDLRLCMIFCSSFYPTTIPYVSKFLIFYALLWMRLYMYEVSGA
jgi:hypothetical protein